MSSLYDRLKPEYKAKLENQAIQYPFAIEAFFKEFKNATFVMDLRFGSIVFLSNFLRLPDYNFTTISNLFEEP